jgi:tripartite-type tricarboxylate transporter receptor subunit TctC
VRQLNQDASQALSDAQVRQKLLALGLQPEPGGSADFAAFIDSEVKKWGTLVRARGLCSSEAGGACWHPNRALMR